MERGGVDGLVDVVSNPAEAFTVALTLQHGTHEQLQGAAGQLVPRDFVLWGEGGEVRRWLIIGSKYRE